MRPPSTGCSRPQIRSIYQYEIPPAVQNRSALRVKRPEWLDTLTPERLLVCLFFVLVWTLAALMRPQSDTWWQLRAGQDFWRDAAVPLVESYSHTVTGGFWMNHEWLTHAIFYGLYSIGGLPLLNAVAATVCTGAIAMTWSLMSGPTMIRLGLIALSILTFARGWSPRPYIFTMLLLGLTAKLLLSKRSWWLPLVFVVWANLHGGFTMGIALVGASVIAAVPDGRVAVQRRLALLGCCLIASLATPLGWTFYEELPGSLARLKTYQISEWQTPTLDNPSLHAFGSRSRSCLSRLLGAGERSSPKRTTGSWSWVRLFSFRSRLVTFAVLPHSWCWRSRRSHEHFPWGCLERPPPSLSKFMQVIVYKLLTGILRTTIPSLYPAF